MERAPTQERSRPVRGRPSLYWYEPNRQLATRAAARQAIRVVCWVHTRQGWSTAPGEQDLFVAMHACAYRAAQAEGRFHSRQQLWARRWRAIRDYLVEHNMGLLYSMLRRFASSKLDIDELRSEGLMALLRAVDRFRPSRGLCFSTYACNALGRAMARLCRSRGGRGKLLTNIEFTAVDPPTSIADRHTELAVDRLSRVLHNNFAQLTELERGILASRFAENVREELTFREIGQEVGLSKERIRQIQNTALHKLRQALEADQVLELAS